MSFDSRGFEMWLQKQHQLGHDRIWLRNNVPSLKRRWMEDRSDLEHAPQPIKRFPNRYDEL